MKTNWKEIKAEIDGLWIQIRDHRKTIERLETERKTLANFMKNNKDLKQKLQQLIDELKHRPSEKGASYSTYQEGWLDGMALAIQKFEELLKEEKELK